MKKKTIIILLSAVILIFATHLPSSAFRFHDKMLRVCVLKDAASLMLTIKGDYMIFTLKTNEVIEVGKNLRKAEVVPSSKGLIINNEPFNVYGVKIVPRRDALVYIGRRSFRGNIDIIRTEDLKLLVINHLDLEDYLKGVLYHEVSHWWPMETLRAQAIAARTYAVYQKSRSERRDFDLTNDIYSQVYGGRGSEKVRTNRAVDSTRGEALFFNNEIFPTYYHATCGGRTENASNLWNIDLPPLKGVKCNFCKFSPHYKWKYSISLEDIEEPLRSSGYKIEGLKKIKIQGKDASGRIEKLKLIAKRDILIPAKDFRLIIGPNHIRSTNFTIKMKNDHLTFYGCGWGHGVGMCQWGAFFLGLKRYRAKDILRYYYPGTRIKKI